MPGWPGGGPADAIREPGGIVNEIAHASVLIAGTAWVLLKSASTDSRTARPGAACIAVRSAASWLTTAEPVGGCSRIPTWARSAELTELSIGRCSALTSSSEVPAFGRRLAQDRAPPPAPGDAATGRSIDKPTPSPATRARNRGTSAENRQPGRQAPASRGLRLFYYITFISLPFNIA